MRILLFAAIILAVVAALYLFSISPRRSRLREMRKFRATKFAHRGYHFNACYFHNSFHKNPKPGKHAYPPNLRRFILIPQ